MDTISELGQILGPLRRAVLRKARLAGHLPDLPEAQIEMLRVLIDAGPIASGDVAARLRVAPSTVSNLARQMASAGLLQRIASATDLRTVQLAASDHAVQLFEQYNATSRAALQQAMDGLSKTHQQHLERALPALKLLLVELEDNAPAGAGNDD